ncbi:hypothetical protein V2J52_16775 [Georgenia sp. MJ173]|uniref:DUF6932 family protein n=1 Tax=Georgenia sunbinii TaxID=3117728 RepID=UPI002F267E33
MIPPLTAVGALPRGRYPATIPEVESAFVADPMWAASTTRPTVWADWLQVTAQARKVVPVAAAWLGGSFLTDKLNPDDLDVIYLIDARQAAAVTSPLYRGFLSLLSQGQALRTLRGSRLDTFVIDWVPDPDGARMAPGFSDYVADRGYWDDLWQRSLSGPKMAPRVPSDALPKRGYLEVILDDFQP